MKYRRLTEENIEATGFVMGYYKEFDDLKAYFLEEIVIFTGFQNKGYGTLFLQELGFYPATNLTMMGKHFLAPI